MTRNGSKFAHRIRWSYELLFSLYAANFVAEKEGVKEGSRFLDLLAVPLVSFDPHLSHWRDGRLLFPPTDVLPNELFYASICVFAQILFVCLRLLGWSRWGKALVDCVAVTSLVIGPLVITIWTRSNFEGNENWNAGKLHVSRWLEPTEVVFLLVFVALWRLRKWPIKGVVALLSFHFLFWGFILLGQDWWRCLPGLKHLLLPLAASLMWVWSANVQSSTHASP